MAQVKVTSYYSRRKRIDDAQPSKRRKLLQSTTEEESALSSIGKSDLKAGLHAFTKQFLPEVDRAVLLQDTFSQCTKYTTSTVRPKSTRKTRTTTSTRNSKKTQGPLDKHLEKVSHRHSVSPNALDLQECESFDKDVLENVHVSVTVNRSPPSTPTKRPQPSQDEAPSRKKRRRIGSADVVLEMDASSEREITGPVPLCAVRRKVQAGKKQSSTHGKSAKKSLESSLKECLKNEEFDTRHDYTKELAVKSSKIISFSKGRKSNKQESSKSDATQNGQGTSDSVAVLLDPGNLERFIERSSQSVKSSGVKGSKFNTALSDHIRDTVREVQHSPSKDIESNGSSVKDRNKMKLTPTEMKERLSKSCKLSDLQSRLSKVKKFADQAKSLQKATNNVSTTSSSNTKTRVASIIKTEEPLMPAYQKYHSLVESAPSTLNLPFKYKILEELFRSMDTVVSMLHNRSEICSFPKLKLAVQEICRRTFELRNIGQIKTVYPTAYFLRQQKMAAKGINDRSVNNYEMVVEANTASGFETSTVQESSDQVKQSCQITAKNDAMSKLISKFTPSMLIARRSIFHNNLVEIVKKNHNEFLSKLDRPLSVPSDKLTRWHPKFPLDQIPEVEPSTLPQHSVVTTYNSAKDVLDKARVMMNPRVAMALQVVAKNSALLKAEQDKKKAEQDKKKAEQKTVAKQQPNEEPKKLTSVSGVNQSLLDRIRAKEAQNLTAMMTRNPADQERIAMLERLPELCRILRIFVAEKKAAIPIETAVQKLIESYQSSLSKAQCEKHVALMVEVLPEWISKVTVRKDHYLKINKTKNMVQVTDCLKQLLRESKQAKSQS